MNFLPALRFQEGFAGGGTEWCWWDSWGCPVQGQGLDFMILVHPFQLRIFCNSRMLQGGVGVRSREASRVPAPVGCGSGLCQAELQVPFKLSFKPGSFLRHLHGGLQCRSRRHCWHCVRGWWQPGSQGTVSPRHCPLLGVAVLAARLLCQRRLELGWLRRTARSVIFTMRWINEGPD